MHSILKAAFVLGSLALAGAATAQPTPPTWQPAPSITASLNIGGTGNFTGVFENQRLCYMINAPGVKDPTRVRIGLAVCDPLGISVRGLDTVARGPSLEEAARAVAAALRPETPERVVVGVPVRADGSEGETGKEARAFGVSGVPTFIVGSAQIVGAQSPEVFVSMLKRVAERGLA